MSLTGNGIFVVRGEMSTLMTAMRRGTRWNSTTYMDEEKDGLMKLFVDLKQTLNRIEDLRLIDPNVFLAPFLEVIRTDETTGVVTSLALSAINKFLSYGLIDPTSPNLAITVENIVDAVTHARFMGTDNSTDGVTLFRVVEVLHTLMRSPEGSALTNESVCEVMLSCFKICFEPRLNELLRRSAEQTLKDMVLLLFMRLPQFSEDRSEAGLLKKFQMLAASMEQDKKQRKKQAKPSSQMQRSASQRDVAGKTEAERKVSTASAPATDDPKSPLTTLGVSHLKAPPLATTPATPGGNILDMQGKITQTPTTSLVGAPEVVDGFMPATQQEENNSSVLRDLNAPTIAVDPASPQAGEDTDRPQSANGLQAVSTSALDGSSEYINSVGVRFTQQNSVDGSEGVAPLLPYGLPCIQELFRFLILLCNPLDKQNTDAMMHMGLSLLTVAFEVGADNIGKYDTLLELVKDDLCRNLLALMNSERLTIFAADLQLCFLLFESLRGHLKFQMEEYLKKLSELIASDNPKKPYEMRELALDNLLQLWRIPGFVAELYINYDCDLYCSDMFENLTNLLSKYTLSATNAVDSTHIIAMDTLITVIDYIERNCVMAKNVDNGGGVLAATAASQTPNRHSRHNSGLDGIIIDSANEDNKSVVVVENISKFINSSTRLRLLSGGGSSVAEASITREHLNDVKQKKRVLTQGTELFNQRPDKGIQYLQENGILNLQLDPMEVALFLRENPGLDKKMIGEYISKKKNVDSKILMNFVDSFDFAGLRVDQALRLYLETFRLPGEAPLIFLVLEHFADHWHKQNGEPFANTDAAFSLAYAIIMLNMDQHNSNAKRLNVPMTPEDFLKNLRGLNGGSDFDQEMLSAVFSAIKNEEIVMPAEQTGLVRENYQWKVLLRRGINNDGVFNYVQDSAYDMEIFNIIWGASLSALSFMFDKSSENGYQRTLTGFIKSAGISAHYNMHEDFDALILTLCKFTTLQNSVQQETPTPAHNEIVQAVNFGLNPKAQAAIRTVFALVHDYGDCLREGWKDILDLHLQLFRLKLLPKSLMEVEDFCEANGKAHLIIEKPSQKQEAGLFSSLYSYLSSEGQREPSYEEQEFIKIGKKCIKECQLDQMIQESKFVQPESLQELIRSVLTLIKAPNAHKSVGLPYTEDVVVFWMEYLVKIVIHNRDRMIPLWPAVRDQMYLLLMGGASCGYDYLLNRSIVAVLKLGIYLMRNENLCPIVLQSLKMLLMLKPAVVLRISKQISIGIYELLKTSAQNIHSEQDWQIIFTILECVGAGAIPPEFEDAALPVPNGSGAKSEGAMSSEDDSGLPDRGYISDSEVSAKQQLLQQQQYAATHNSQTSSSFPSSPTTENWIVVNKDTDLSTLSRPQSPPSTLASSSLVPALSTLVYNCKLIEHSPFALFKCWDSLAFIVRHAAHIKIDNFESCMRCIRTFVEACRDGGIRQRRKFEAAMAEKASNAAALAAAGGQKKKSVSRRGERETQTRKSNGQDSNGQELLSDCEDAEDLAQSYETLSIQLLDLMYTLYTRTAQIFSKWKKDSAAAPQCSAVWAQGWCPLLQGIARLAMDRRREVRTYAISCLQQRALLFHDLQTLSGAEWASCFQQVLFPLLNELLPESASVAYLDVVLLEESRIRMATIMSKVFLQHLTPLIQLGGAFNELWLEILDYIEKFMKVGSDMLSEQMQEILKNMLLVMDYDGTLHPPLWELTWRRIGEFLPHLKEELFPQEVNRAQAMSHASASTTPTGTNQSAADIGLVPQVAILPKQQQQYQQQQSAELIVTQTPIMSPVESPRHSIILQPPVADIFQGPQFILGQVAPPQNMPYLVPQQTAIQHHQQQHQQQQSPATSPTSFYNTINHLSMQATTPMLVQPIPILAKAPPTPSVAPSILPDLVNDGAAQITHQLDTPVDSPKKELPQQQQQQQHATTPPTVVTTNNTYSNYSFAIELPETPPAAELYADQQQQQSTDQQHQQHEQHEAIEQQKLQEQYNLYYQKYQQHLMHQQQTQQQQTQQQQTQQQQQLQQQQQQQQQHQQQHQQQPPQQQPQQQPPQQQPTAQPDIEAPSPQVTSPSDVNSHQSHIISQNNGESLIDSTPVPISHLLAGNQYPSLPKIPNSAIVHSFSPVYMQTQAPQTGADIYQEYVQNPYNLTLQQQQQQQTQTQTLQQISSDQQQQQQEQTNLFATTTPANYFSSSVDPSAIPPGSEMLYGQP